MEPFFSISDLEKCYIKATTSMRLGKREIEVGEVICKFDKIKVGGLNGIVDSVAAKGGKHNIERVMWEEVKGVPLKFMQGVYSLSQMAVINNSQIYEENEGIVLTATEEKESNEYGIFTLNNKPVDIFIYDIDGNKIKNFETNEKEINITVPFKEVSVVYTYKYNNSYKTLGIGTELLKAPVSVEGFTKMKEDEFGNVRSVFLEIPRLKINSNIRLDFNNDPNTMVFDGIALPDTKGEKDIARYHFLNNDLGSDF